MNAKFFLKQPLTVDGAEDAKADPVEYLELSGLIGSEKEVVHRLATDADKAQYGSEYAAFKKEPKTPAEVLAAKRAALEAELDALDAQEKAAAGVVPIALGSDAKATGSP